MGEPGKRVERRADLRDPEPPGPEDMVYTSEEQLAKMNMDELRELAERTVTAVTDSQALDRETLLRAILDASV